MNVLVYAGPGTSKQGVELLRSSLAALLSDSYAVMLASPKMMREEPWEDVTVLLAFPGGRDIPYLEELGGAANARIKQWVQTGGKYLGICAGAYYGAASIQFDLGGTNHISGTRELGFFHGVCSGPTYPGFVYDSESGARDAPLLLSNILNGPTSAIATQGAYWNGGCAFEPAPNSMDWTALAFYADLESNPIAAVLCKVGQGLAILSGFHPEYPLVSAASHANIGTNLLAKFLTLLQLDITAEQAQPPMQTPIYLYTGSTDALASFTAQLALTYQVKVGESMSDSKDTLRLVDDAQIGEAHSSEKMLVISQHPPASRTFDVALFWSALQTRSLARLLLYGEVMESTQTLLDKNPRFLNCMPDGALALASFQTSGRGRGSNAWLSPAGSLAFSFVARMPLDLAAKIVFIQYLFALAVVEALDQPEENGRKLGICIKWPNDIYADMGVTQDGARYRKIGGILVNSSYAKNEFTLVIGSGINHSNAKPTLSLTDLVSSYNTRYSTHLPAPRIEETLGKVLNAFEPMLEAFKRCKSFGPFMARYTNSWIHNQQIIQIAESGRMAQIDSITSDHGLLRARYVDSNNRYEGDHVDLQPDGNSFDMLKGLISRKM